LKANGPVFGLFRSAKHSEANPPPSKEERSVAAKLTNVDFRVIDAAILANASDRWLKVARVILRTEEALGDRFPGLSYIFYTRRLMWLVEQGRLDSQGNLESMRFSEVRIPAQAPQEEGSSQEKLP